MPELVLIALATLVTEDLTCIAAGVLVAQGRLAWLPATLACLAGILVGDVLLFLAGRLIGPPALGWRVVRRWVSPEQVGRASQWLSARGAAVVLLSRFVPGLRLPTYFAAGMLKTSFWRFSLYFLLAAAIWTPLLVGVTAAAGAQVVGTALLAGGRGAAGVAIACAVWIAARKVASFRSRRKLVAFSKRIVRWEFWPPWAAYLPVVPYVVWLGLRHRSLTLFTAANPGIPGGGFCGESKSAILGSLDSASVARYAVIPGSLEPSARVRRAAAFMAREGLGLPIVLKPDIGERGSGVAIARSEAELRAYLGSAAGDTIIQEYIDGVEFGVFYYRFPNAPLGRLLSITDKRFPHVTGDGRSTVEELILRDARAVCLAAAYLKGLRRPASDVPAPGERVPLAELGSHCRGAVFLDGGRLKTPALEAAVERIAASFPGFFFGRFDIRTCSGEAFREGRFKVIELNGVTAEATHIYDPAVSLVEAYRVMFTQWRLAFEIGSLNRRLGARPAGVIELLRLVAARRRRAEAKLTHARAIEVLD